MLPDEVSPSATSSPLQFFTMTPPSLGSPYPWHRYLKSEERGLCLIHLLLSCANHVAARNLENANVNLEQISLLACPDGDTVQRMAAYFTEALADRIVKAWPGLYKALHSTRISSVSEEILVRKVFFEMLPFLKVAYVLTNQAIVEAMEGEKMVHIVDLNSSEPARWIALLHKLCARPEGPPHLRITGVHEHKEVLDQMAFSLIEEAEKLDIPFQFSPVISNLDTLNFERLRVKTGEALAISSVLQFHSLLSPEDDFHRRNFSLESMNPNGANSPGVLQMGKGTLGELLEKEMAKGYSPSSDSTSSSSPLSPVGPTKMDNFLHALWGLSPKLMVLTEQDSNHNGSTLMERLFEALYSYAALFDCLESTVSRTSLERMKLEKMLFGEEIKNIIACEGYERKERHEKLEKWIQRLDLAGFGNVPLNYCGMVQAKNVLQGYGCDGYQISREENGCVLMSWHRRPLFSVSSWRCRK